MCLTFYEDSALYIMLKRWVLSFFFKVLKLVSHLSLDGRSFHIHGPHIVKEKFWHWAICAQLSGSLLCSADLICLLWGLMTKLLRYSGAWLVFC